MALAVAAENGGEKDAVEATVTDVKDDDAKKDEARQLEKEAEAEKERVGESDKTSMVRERERQMEEHDAMGKEGSESNGAPPDVPTFNVQLSLPTYRGC